MQDTQQTKRIVLQEEQEVRLHSMLQIQPQESRRGLAGRGIQIGACKDVVAGLQKMIEECSQKKAEGVCERSLEAEREQ